MKKQKYFKCPKCGEPTVQDPLGYSPSVPYCTKCNHICDWECPEAERLGLGSEEEYKIYLKGKKEVFRDISLLIQRLTTVDAQLQHQKFKIKRESDGKVYHSLTRALLEDLDDVRKKHLGK